MGNSDLAAVEAKYQKVAETIQHLTQENAHLKRELEAAQSMPRDNGENAALKAEIASLQETVAGLEQVRDNLIEKINTLYMVTGTESRGEVETPEDAPASRPTPQAEAPVPKAAPHPAPVEPVSKGHEAHPIREEKPRPPAAPVETPRPAAHVPPESPRPTPVVVPEPPKAHAAAPAVPAKAPEPVAPAAGVKPEKDDEWKEDDPFDVEDETVFEDNDQFFRSLTSKDSE